MIRLDSIIPSSEEEANATNENNDMPDETDDELNDNENVTEQQSLMNTVLTMDDTEERFGKYDQPKTYWTTSIMEAAFSRLPMLVCLLLFQSISSFILQSVEDSVLRPHMFISFFMTMLVGTGGNAGGQSAAAVLQGLASGEIAMSNRWELLLKESLTGFLLAFALSIVGFARAVMQKQTFLDSVVLGVILFFIVVSSIVLGTLLPLGFLKLQKIIRRRYGEEIGLFFDPANASFPTFQVAMDILGILITVSIALLFFNVLGFKDSSGPDVNGDCVCNHTQAA